MAKTDSKFWQASKTQIGFIEYSGHGETPAQRRNKLEIERRTQNGESASSIYKSMQSEGRGMRKQELLEIAGYVKARRSGEAVKPRTYQPEAIRKTPRQTKAGESRQYKPTNHGTMQARGETRQPYEYIVKVGSHESDKQTTKTGKPKRVGTFVTVVSDRPLTDREIKSQADKMNISQYGSKSRRYAAIRIMGVRIR